MRGLVALFVLLTCALGSAQELTEKSYARWRAYLLPSKDELRWTEIGWRASFRAGVLEGAATGKPVLLWTMNGHPLGCT